MSIVDIVGDARMNGMDRDALPQVFWPMPHLPSADVWLIVRIREGASATASSIVQAVREIDPDIGVVESTTMSRSPVTRCGAHF